MQSIQSIICGYIAAVEMVILLIKYGNLVWGYLLSRNNHTQKLSCKTTY